MTGTDILYCAAQNKRGRLVCILVKAGANPVIGQQFLGSQTPPAHLHNQHDQQYEDKQ